MSSLSNQLLQDPLFSNDSNAPVDNVLNESWRVDFDDFTLNYYLCSYKAPVKKLSSLENDFAGLCFNMQSPVRHAGFPKGSMQTKEFNVLYIPQGHYEYTVEKETCVITIHFKRHFFDRIKTAVPLLNSPVMWKGRKKNFTICSEVLDIFEAVFGRWTKFPVTAKHLYLKARLGEVIAESLDQFVSGFDPGDSVLRRHLSAIIEAHDYLLNHLEDSFPLHDLVFITGLNRHKLEQGFKALYGTTVHDFLIDKRMEKAKALLRDTTMTIPNIMTAVGYKSLSNFMRTFKKKYGEMPRM